MTNIYANHPELTSHASRVAVVRTTEEGRQAVVLEENILRPAGGGQPQDHGRLVVDGGETPVGAISKFGGDTWLEIDGPLHRPLRVGDAVISHLDADRRHNLSRCHSLTHLGMAVVRRFVPGYESKGAEIADTADGVTLYFRGGVTPSAEDLYRIDGRMRSLIFQQVPIRVERAKSLEAAAQSYACWRVDPDNQLSGRIRIIHIEGIDANPCSGSHVADTSEIGPFKMGACRTDGRGVSELKIQRQNVWMDW